MKNFSESHNAIQLKATLGIFFNPLTLPLKKSGLEKVRNLFKVILLVKGRPRKTSEVKIS